MSKAEAVLYQPDGALRGSSLIQQGFLALVLLLCSPHLFSLHKELWKLCEVWIIFASHCPPLFPPSWMILEHSCTNQWCAWQDIGEEEGEEKGGHRMLLNWISARQGRNMKELPELPRTSWCSWLWWIQCYWRLDWLDFNSCTCLGVLAQPEGSDPKACAAFWDLQPHWHQNLCVRADEWVSWGWCGCACGWDCGGAEIVS